MAARLIRATDAMEVKQLGVLVYGQPGSRKTSTAQTADKPFTFAFDPGIYRAYGRKDCALFEDWNDVIELTNGKGDPELVAAVKDAKTIVLDTVGAGMKKMADAIMAESPKNGNRMGGLALAGYGILANRFEGWVQQIFARGQDLVMVAHEDSTKRGDDDYYHPAFVGQKFYTTAMGYADMVGYMHFENGKRVIDFAPTDRFFAKIPPSGVGQIALPDFGAETNFLGKLIADAKASMGRISSESAKIAGVVEEWRAKLADPTVGKLNGVFADYSALKEPIKTQVRVLLFKASESVQATFDKAAGKFKPAEKPTEAKPEDANGTPAQTLKELRDKIEVRAVEVGVSLQGKWPDGEPIMPKGKRLSTLTVEEARFVLKGMMAMSLEGATP